MKTGIRQNCFTRYGFASTALVAAMGMVMIFGFATGLCYRVSLVWRDIRQQRVATAELSNQLDRLTVNLDRESARQHLERIEPSPYATATLIDPSLSGELIETELGTQIRLQLDWKRRFPGKPVSLSAWLGEPVEEMDERH